jgi:protein-S-isoprenylcysteine O-methyltransferase Ste14
LCLYQQSISILLLSAPVFLLFRLVVVHIEEPALRKKFGAAYQEYCGSVPRWIPRRREVR